MVSLSWIKIAAYAVNIVVVMVILRMLLWKPVIKFLDARQVKFAQQRKDLDARQGEMDTQKAQHDARMAQAHTEVEDIIRRGRAEAETRAQAIVDEAEKQAKDIIQQARRDAQDEMKLARQNIHAEIADLAVKVAARVLEREISAEDNREIIERFFAHQKVG